MTKVLYAIRSKAFFSYQESAIDALREEGAEVILAFDEFWSNNGGHSHIAFERWIAKHPDVKWVYFPIRKNIWRPILMFARELRSYNNYCNRSSEFEFYRNRWSYYLRLGETIRLLANSNTGRKILGRREVRRVTAAVEKFIPADPKIVAWLKSLKVDAVVATPVNMRFSEEIELIKAARLLKVPSYIPILSWDNASTKGLFHIAPTAVLAWHEGHMNECLAYHSLKKKQVIITGSPFFDKWFDAINAPTPRESFCARVGLDPNRPYVLYLGSSANIAKDETWLVREIEQAIRASDDPTINNIQVLFRAHPANWKNGLGLLEDGVAVWPREGSLPDDEESFNDFRDSLAHAVAAIGLNTTGMVDAIVVDKPVISPLVDKYRLTQEKAQHFARMRSALYIAPTVADVITTIGKLSNGEDSLAEQRKEFVSRFVRPNGLDKSAGYWIARTVLGQQIQAEQFDISLLFEKFDEKCAALRHSDLFVFYDHARVRILEMMKNYTTSAYWFEEIAGFDYLFDASPLVVSKLREHCYHITGERSYTYRTHHSHKAGPFLKRLEDLKAIDKSNLLVPESPACGGFGFDSPDGMINTDTLKFYEVLIGMDRAGFLDDFKGEQSSRRAVLEIGSGWGGFAYQFNHLFKNTTYFCIDLPATLLFAAIYLRGACPDAKIVLWGDLPPEEIFKRWQEFDFVLMPAHALDQFKPRQLDLTVNICSFQEMTTEQVTGYVDHAASLDCEKLYSLNRDRSPHNSELTLVSEILKTCYDCKIINVLPTEYCTVGTKIKPKSNNLSPSNWSAYRHMSGRLQKV
jgi:hypothetical protein